MVVLILLCMRREPYHLALLTSQEYRLTYPMIVYHISAYLMRGAAVYIEILILAQLARQPAHGYEIKRSVQQTLGETYAINNNQLYPTLRRLEEMGAITREVERQVGRPDRHIYHMTTRGEQTLQDVLRDFPPELAHDVVEFQVRVAFFRLLAPQTRLTILRTREAVLRGQLEH